MLVLSGVFELFLWAVLLLLIARLVVDWVQLFARSWVPAGVALVVCEGIYTATDPPVRLFRRFIPPLRLGSVSLDLSMLLLLLIVVILRAANREFLMAY